MDDRWGPPSPYIGDALVDLHGGKGTEWARTADGAYYPTCDCHCPPALKVEDPGPVPSGTPDAPPVVTEVEVAFADDDPEGLHLLLAFLRRLVKEHP